MQQQVTGTTLRVDITNIYDYYSTNGTITTTTTYTYYDTCITTYTDIYNEKHEAYILNNINKHTSPDIE